MRKQDQIGKKVGASRERAKAGANGAANLNANVSANGGGNNDRLSWGDTVFLHLEREGMPLNVACVCVFEGEVPFKDCVQFVESKLPLIPRYLKRVVPPLFNIGL